MGRSCRPRRAAFARGANDELAEKVAAHPDRFTGLLAVAPHGPEAAIAEIERGMTRLDMRGVIINDHTHEEHLDHPRFLPVLEAAEAFDAPIYLHPSTAARDMISPFLKAGPDGAIYGFGVHTGLHALRMITAGVFDRSPRLQVVLGHMGEALPCWVYRLGYMHEATVRSNRYAAIRPL